MIRQLRKICDIDDQAPDDAVGQFSWDMVANSVTGDAEVARLFGFSPVLLATGLSIEPMIAQIHLNDRARVARSIHAAIVDGTLYQERYRVTADGTSYYWVFSVGRCFGYTDGLPTLWTGFVCAVAAPDEILSERTGAVSNVVKFRR